MSVVEPEVETGEGCLLTIAFLSPFILMIYKGCDGKTR